MKSSQLEWTITVGKKEFGITKQEYELIKVAANAGKTMIWLEDKVISIPHISYMEKITQPVYKVPQLPEPIAVNVREKIQAIREKLKKHVTV